jgi:hypothetical protein
LTIPALQVVADFLSTAVGISKACGSARRSRFLSKQQGMEQLPLAYDLNDHLAELNLRCHNEPENFVDGKFFTVKLDDLSIWPKIGHHFAHWLLANLTDEMDLVQHYVVGSLFRTATSDFVFAIKHNDCWRYSG